MGYRAINYDGYLRNNIIIMYNATYNRKPIWAFYTKKSKGGELKVIELSILWKFDLFILTLDDLDLLFIFVGLTS